MTRALIRNLPAVGGMNVLEPCAGANAITRVLESEAGCVVSAFDIEPRDPRVTQADTLTPGFFEQIALAMDATTLALVTNPPFSLAAAYARRSVLFGLTALLVRITWLEATKDREDIRDPDAVIVLPRGRFTGPGATNPLTGEPYSGGDSATVIWAIWSQTPLLPGFAIRRVNRREKAELEQPARLLLEAVS